MAPGAAWCEGTRTRDQAPFGRRIALTFDDGPNLETTPLVLRALRAQEAPATFFVLGSRLDNERSRALLREIETDPLFQVGNHTWDHPHLRAVSSSQLDMQLDDTMVAIRDALNEPCHEIEYLRFPFGEASCRETEAAARRGMIAVGVDIDPVDWCFGFGGGTCAPEVDPRVPDAFRSDLVANAVSEAERTGGGIMLLHDVHSNTARLLPEILRSLQEAGFTFVALSEFARLHTDSTTTGETRVPN